MGNKKNKKSRKGKLGGASSIAASGHSRGELLKESSEVAGAIIPDNEQVLDDDAGGHGGIEEETARDLTVFFGEEARNDDCTISCISITTTRGTVPCIIITTNPATFPCIIITTNPATSFNRATRVSEMGTSHA
ncbi:hypothetical protein Bca101_089113 [Brassica carinata]